MTFIKISIPIPTALFVHGNRIKLKHEGQDSTPISGIGKMKEKQPWEPNMDTSEEQNQNDHVSYDDTGDNTPKQTKNDTNNEIYTSEVTHQKEESTWANALETESWVEQEENWHKGQPEEKGDLTQRLEEIQRMTNNNKSNSSPRKSPRKKNKKRKADRKEKSAVKVLRQVDFDETIEESQTEMDSHPETFSDTGSNEDIEYDNGLSTGSMDEDDSNTHDNDKYYST